MDRRDYSDLGNQIKRTVENAVETMNFEQLNKDISNTVNSALSEAKYQLYRARQSKPSNTGTYNQQMYNKANNLKKREYERPTQLNKNKYSYELVTRKPAGKVSGIIMQCIGYFGVISMAITVLVLMIVGIATGNFGTFMAISSGFIALLIGSIVLLGVGIRVRRRYKRFKKYMMHIHDRDYCTIKELSRASGLTEKFIKKDLKKMIALNYFPKGRLDEKNTCLMLSDEAYDQYLIAKEQYEQRQREQNKNDASQMTEEDKALNAVITEGNEYIRQIKEANDAIEEIEFSNKLYRLEEIITKIFECVKENKAQLPEIRRFMEYYLPTTLKLVNAYRDFSRATIEVENIRKSKEEIKSTLDTINKAFENLLDSLYEDAAMEISTDISVLQTLFAQEGLAEKDFK